jgi:hypothetical protein
MDSEKESFGAYFTQKEKNSYVRENTLCFVVGLVALYIPLFAFKKGNIGPISAQFLASFHLISTT